MWQDQINYFISNSTLLHFYWSKLTVLLQPFQFAVTQHIHKTKQYVDVFIFGKLDEHFSFTVGFRLILWFSGPMVCHNQGSFGLPTIPNSDLQVSSCPGFLLYHCLFHALTHSFISVHAMSFPSLTFSLSGCGFIILMPVVVTKLVPQQQSSASRVTQGTDISFPPC